MPPFGNRLPEVEILGSGFTNTELGYANLEKARIAGTILSASPDGANYPGQTLVKPVSKAPIGRLQPSVRHSSASLAIASASRSPLEPLPACSMAWFSSWSTRGLAVFRYGATRASASADRA